MVNNNMEMIWLDMVDQVDLVDHHSMRIRLYLHKTTCQICLVLLLLLKQEKWQLLLLKIQMKMRMKDNKIILIIVMNGEVLPKYAAIVSTAHGF